MTMTVVDILDLCKTNNVEMYFRIDPTGEYHILIHKQTSPKKTFSKSVHFTEETIRETHFEAIGDIVTKSILDALCEIEEFIDVYDKEGSDDETN